MNLCASCYFFNLKFKSSSTYLRVLSWSSVYKTYTEKDCKNLWYTSLMGTSGLMSNQLSNHPISRTEKLKVKNFNIKEKIKPKIDLVICKSDLRIKHTFSKVRTMTDDTWKINSKDHWLGYCKTLTASPQE